MSRWLYFPAATPTTLVEVSRLAGTAIGNMTVGGGLASCFNGNTFQAAGSSAGKAGTPGYVGKDWGSGVTRLISQYYVYSTNGGGGSTGFGDSGAINIDISLYGSNSAPAGATDGTLLHTIATFVDASNTLKQVTTGVTEGNYRYHWVVITTAAGNTYCSQVRFWELV